MSVQLDYTCRGCETEIKLDVSYFCGRLDSALPNECPVCGAPTADEKQIEERYEDHVASE